MDPFNKLSTQFAGAMLITGPGLVVCAALLVAAGIETTTGRWYDNWLEGILMAAGFSLQLVGLLELSRRIGAIRPGLGILGQSSFEVNMPAYIAGVTAWLLGLAPLGLGILCEFGAVQQALDGAGSSG